MDAAAGPRNGWRRRSRPPSTAPRWRMRRGRRWNAGPGRGTGAAGRDPVRRGARRISALSGRVQRTLSTRASGRVGDLAALGPRAERCSACGGTTGCSARGRPAAGRGDRRGHGQGAVAGRGPHGVPGPGRDRTGCGRWRRPGTRCWTRSPRCRWTWRTSGGRGDPRERRRGGAAGSARRGARARVGAGPEPGRAEGARHRETLGDWLAGLFAVAREEVLASPEPGRGARTSS